MYYASLICLVISILISYIFLHKSSPKKIYVRYLYLYFLFYFVACNYLHYSKNIFIEVSWLDGYINPLININIIYSLGFFLLTVSYFLTTSKKIKISSKINIDYNKLFYYSIVIFLFAILLYFYLLITNPQALFMQDDSAEDVGFLFYYILIENIPIFMTWIIFSYCIKNKIKLNKLKGLLIFLLVLLFTIIFSGLRGSRISLLLQIINFIILYSLIYKVVGFRLILLMFFSMFIFNNFFSIYKYGGFSGVKDYISYGEKPAHIENNISGLKVIVHDFGRNDVQAYIFNEILNGRYEVSYIPDSYLYTLSKIFPITKNNYYSKEELGYAVQNQNTPIKESKSTRIYGLFGESALNFGIGGVFIAFIFYGFFLKILISNINNFFQSRFYFLAPLYCLMPIFILFYDFGNILFMLVKSWLLPIFIILLATKNVK